jgi:hypothetical protein
MTSSITCFYMFVCYFTLALSRILFRLRLHLWNLVYRAMDTPRLSPRTWSSKSFCSLPHPQDKTPATALAQASALRDALAYGRNMSYGKENKKPAHPLLVSPAKKTRSFRQRVYHQTSWITPSPPLLQLSPGLPQPFLYLGQDPHLLPCVYSLETKSSRIHPACLSNVSSIADTQFFWLVLYFVFNLGLTLYNKVVLVRFPFPYTLTALHALSGTIGGYLMLESGAFVPARLSLVESMILAAFSVLYAVNIAVSNVSLQLVTVPVSVPHTHGHARS